MIAAVGVFFAYLGIIDGTIKSIDAVTSDRSPTNSLCRFISYPPSKGKLGFPRSLFETPFRANPNFWLKGVDFSCASPWNDSFGAQRAGTLISKRHLVFAKHFPLLSGDRILFVGVDGEVCPCNIEKTKGIAGTDIMIGALNAEVTPNIHPAKVLPDNFSSYIGTGKGLPVVTLTQSERAILSEVNAIPTNGAPARYWISEPKSATWARFNERIESGDSGNPAFLLLGNDLILLYCLRGGGVGSGPWLHLHRNEIQMAMDKLCPGYKLEEFDFNECLRRMNADGKGR